MDKIRPYKIQHQTQVHLPKRLGLLPLHLFDHLCPNIPDHPRSNLAKQPNLAVDQNRARGRRCFVAFNVSELATEVLVGRPRHNPRVLSRHRQPVNGVLRQI